MATAWKNFCFILSERSDFHMVINQSKAVHAFPMHTLPRYMNRSINFRNLLFNRDVTILIKTWILFYMSSCRDQCLLLPAPSNTAKIWLEQVYLQEALEKYAKNILYINNTLGFRTLAVFSFGERRKRILRDYVLYQHI